AVAMPYLVHTALLPSGYLVLDVVVPDLGRGLGWRVDHADHTGRKHLGRRHAQMVWSVAVVEEPAALACRDGMNQQTQFVDEAGGEQLLHHGDRPGNEDALDAGVGLERVDGIEQVTLD